MDQRFLEYGAAVCRFVDHATGREKAAIQKELTDHMTDHAQALLDAGYDTDHANRIALEAMGDPEEVGRELNKEYPLYWLLLSRGLLVAALLVAVVLAFWTWQTLDGWEAKLAARSPSLETAQAAAGPVVLHPLDLSHPITEDTTLKLYGVGLWQQEDGSWSAYVCATSYPNRVLDTAGNFAFDLTFHSGHRTLEHGRTASLTAHGVHDHLHDVHGLQYGDPLTARYDRHGVTFELDIPLPWKEVTP